MRLKDKYEIVNKYLETNSVGRLITHIIYIDKENKKLFSFNTKIDFNEIGHIEYEADIKIDFNYEKMIDTKSSQSDPLDLNNINLMNYNGSISNKTYKELFVLLRKLKIKSILEDGVGDGEE